MRYLALMASLLFSASLQAAPQPFQATYNVSAKGLTVGEMTATLSYSPNGYSYQKATKANGVAALLSGDTLTEISNGYKQDNLLIPQHYLNSHKSKRKNKQDEFHFVTPTKIEGAYNGNNYQLDIPAGTIDVALMEIRLMEDLPKNKPLEYQVVNRGKLQTYQLKKAGQETVDVPAGKYTCEKIEVMHTDQDQQTTLWLAPELNYSIVQVRHSEDGNVLETRLNRFTPR